MAIRVVFQDQFYFTCMYQYMYIAPICCRSYAYIHFQHIVHNTRLNRDAFKFKMLFIQIERLSNKLDVLKEITRNN